MKTGVQGLAVEERQAAAGESLPVVGTPLASGSRGRPPRSLLVHAERGNPVRVRPPPGAAGKPEVTKAQFPGGTRMPKKRMPVRRKATGNRDTWPALRRPSRITGRIAGRCPDPKGC